MNRNIEPHQPKARDRDQLAECYHEVGISAVSAAARYCEPLKKRPHEPAFYKVLDMVAPKAD